VPIGSESGSLPRVETFVASTRVSVFIITGLSDKSTRILQSQLLLSDKLPSSGVQLAVASRGELGQKLVSKLTLKIRGRSSGAVIEVKSMLSSMNFEEVLTSVTCCAGVIVTRSSWKSKVRPNVWSPGVSGSPPIYIPWNGTPDSTP